MRLSNNTSPQRLLTLIHTTLITLALGLIATGAAAQNLQSVSCPGAALPNYDPFGMREFDPLTSNGAPLLRVTLPGVDSLCNDGTQAVIYVRPAETSFNGYWDDPEDNAGQYGPSDRWVIWFHGGGGCRDEDSCLERWCSAPGTRAFDRAGKMSSLDSYEAIHGQGIFKRRSDNDFSAYNHVLLNYCSSDNWSGSDSKFGITASNGTTYDIEFQGEAIVNDAIASLLTGVTPDNTEDYWEDILPSLSSAQEILFAGDSAGAGGLRHHIDRLTADLTPQLPQGAIINALVDASFTPGLWRPAINWAGAPVADYFNYLVGPVNDGFTFWGTDITAIDESCQDPANAAAHIALGASHPEVCYDTTFTLIHHITTPFFVGMDINDVLGREKYDNWGLLAPPPLFWNAQFNQLLDLATAGAVGFANPGVFGPKCNEHVRITGNKFFSQQVTLPGGGLGLSYHDLLVNWLNGAAPSSQIQLDGVAGPFYTPSSCP